MRLLSLLVLNFAAFSYAGDFSQLKFITEQYPPYNYTENGQKKGLAVQLLLSASKMYGDPLTPDQIQFMPWPRAYKQALSEPNIALFSTTKTQSRADMFKWVGPIAETRIVLLVKKDTPYQQLSDLKGKGKIGVIKQDIGEELALAQGIPASQIRHAPSALSLAKMLAKGRIIAWAYEQNVALWNLTKVGEKSADYKSIHVLKAGELYYAVSKNVTDLSIANLNQAIELARQAK